MLFLLTQAPILVLLYYLAVAAAGLMDLKDLLASNAKYLKNFDNGPRVKTREVISNNDALLTALWLCFWHGAQKFAKCLHFSRANVPRVLGLSNVVQCLTLKQDRKS